MRCSRNQTSLRTGWDKGRVSSKTGINDGEGGLITDYVALKYSSPEKKV